MASTHADPTVSAGTTDVVPAIVLTGICKTFGEVRAVDNVDLSLLPGEVHAVLGENGAGKSTLMNILGGFLAPDAGAIELDGRAVAFKTPRDALAERIGMVHQHFRLVEEFTVAENLAVGLESVKGAGRRELEHHAADLSSRFGFPIDPAKRLWELSVGEKQRVEILRTLGQGAKVMVLDEPTSVLTVAESEVLLETMRRMAAEGNTIVFISHKLNEVMAVADTITVMRKGQVVGQLQKSEAEVSKLAHLTIGDERTQSDVSVERPKDSVIGAAVLSVEGVSAVDDWDTPTLHDLSFELRAGEILGVAGVAGNGQAQLEEVLTGMRPPSAGTIALDGAPMQGRSVRRFIDAGVRYIPEDRRGTGLAPDEPIWRNAILKCYRREPVSRGVLMRKGAAMKVAADLAERVNLSTRQLNTPAAHLSGGNAQKLLAGRELEGDPRYVVAVNPSQGLDVGAVAAMWKQLVEARDRGIGVLLISADLDEILHLSDRLFVLYEGRFVDEATREQADRRRIGVKMGGGDENAH
ncbi:MAG: ABC transporter ATP-binding protein [Actinobacteria bacterium]|nr:ABC transporter ATP-binding protein [Actinomycetota bacterium]